MDAYIGEIRIFGGNFAPRGWAICNGQLLSVSAFTALFSVIGNHYGGDGVSNFALPNLVGSAPIGFGQGPGLTLRTLGESGGAATASLNIAQMAPHTHALNASTDASTTSSPSGAVWAVGGQVRGGVPFYSDNNGITVPMATGAIGIAGQSQDHNNMSPYLSINFIICLQGIYPTHP